MTSLIRIDPRPASASPPLYPLLHAASFLLLGAAAACWGLATYRSFANDADYVNVLLAAHVGLTIASLVLSCAAIMSRTGARWAHVSFFLLLLPACSIVIPIAGTAICVYCLSRVARPVLPALTLGGHRRVRSGARPPSRNARVFSAVPLYRSGLSGTMALAYIVLTHLFFLGRSVIGLFPPVR